MIAAPAVRESRSRAVLVDRVQKAALAAAIECYDRFALDGKKPLGTDYAEAAANAALDVLLPDTTPIGRAFKCPACQVEWARQPLTVRQTEIVRFIAAFRDVQGYAPSFDEIAAHFGFRSLATVHEHLSNLERKGWLSRAYNEARAITLVEGP